MLGLLWMDDSDAVLANKVRDAARAYRTRFGVAATLCFAHPADVSEATTVQGVRVEPRTNILRHHFLVGREEARVQPVERAA